ncbi:hypothetical protein [Pseudomonas viridiflava]|uniref:hypothetical protein n=1 Tax=Pseudomonas viridiflava TaxID=33069 RepID=UPI000F047E56|nr:hypothetical protein [Pseudomonas viridiflava]
MCDVALDAYVNARDFIMFDTRVDASVISDVLVSTLYTQLAADNKVSTMTDYPVWRKTYLDAMTTFGWRLRDSDCYSHAPDRSVPLNVWALIADVFLQRGFVKLPASAGDFVALASSLLASRTHRESSAPRVPEGSISLPGVQFQVSFVSAEHVLNSVLVSFNTQYPLSIDPLLESLDPALIVGGIDVMFFSAELLELHYDMYRDAFDSALAGRKETLTVRIGDLR